MNGMKVNTTTPEGLFFPEKFASAFAFESTFNVGHFRQQAPELSDSISAP
jgi:hypothetical protein